MHPDHRVPDGVGGFRVSSATFKDHDLSVDRALLVEAAGFDHRHTRDRGPGQGVGVAEIVASLARQLKQEVVANAIPANDAHAEVRGDKNAKINGRTVRKSLATRCTYLA